MRLDWMGMIDSTRRRAQHASYMEKQGVTA